jgi:hypothetical protein
MFVRAMENGTSLTQISDRSYVKQRLPFATEHVLVAAPLSDPGRCGDPTHLLLGSASDT